MRTPYWVKRKALNFRRPLRRRKFFVPAAIISVSITLFLGWFSQFLFISEFLKRANAELAAPIVGYQYHKDRDSRNAINKSKDLVEIPEITILKVTDADLNSANETYPPSHRYHARRFEELLDYGTPKALFIDILFLEQRSEAQQFISSLCKLRMAGTKIYVASILPESELSADFKGFTQPADETLVWPVGDKACDLLAAEVSVRKQTDEFTHQAWSYCLDDSLAAESGQATSNSKCQQINSNTYGIKKINSAAYQIYLDLKNPAITFGNTSEMALTWSTESNPNDLIPGAEKLDCRSRLSKFDFLAWPNVIKGIFSEESVKAFCPIFNELTVNELRKHENRGSLIDEQIVFYGYQLDGINDFSYTPAHGIQHAMNVHAMALDNMLVYEEKAKSNKELFDSYRLLAFNIFLQLLIILVAEFLTNSTLIPRLKNYKEPRRTFPNIQHTKSLARKLALISVAPVLILPIMWIGSSLLNLGVMGWIEFAAIGYLSEAIGLRHKIEEDLIAIFS